MLTTNAIEECLSIAYVHAVAGQAGVGLCFPHQDNGIDGTFRLVLEMGAKRIQGGAPLDFQLKATKNCIVSSTEILYDLDAESYKKLIFSRSHGGTPIVLLILALPKDTSDWLQHSEDQLILC